MHMFARMPMDNLFPSDSDGVVVVGHVSMNKKKNARKLQKIAENNSKQVYDNVNNHKNQKNRYQNKSQYQQNYYSQQQYYSSDQSYYQQYYQSGEQQWYKQEQHQKNTSTRRNGRAHQAQAIVVSGVEAKQPDVIMQFTALPDDVLACIIRCAGVATLARLPSTCQVMARTFGDSSVGFWRSFAGPQITPLCRSAFETGPRNAVRRFIFGLEGKWLPAFTEYAKTHNNPLEVLNEADYLVGGMVAIEKPHASGLIRVITSAVKRCDTDFETATSYLAQTMRKMEARREVFNSKLIHEIREAELDIREKGIIARLSVLDDNEPGFDYFQTEATDPVDEWVEWGDEPKQTEFSQADAEFAAEFLELLAPRQ